MTEVRGVPFYLDRGNMIEVDGDVLGIIERIKAIDPRLTVFANEWKGGFDIVEHCLDETDRLVFHVDALDQRAVDRLLRADQWRGRQDPDHMLPEGEDFLAKFEEEEPDYDHLDDEARDRIRDAGERLAWALEEDGQGVGASISVPRSPNGSDE